MADVPIAGSNHAFPYFEICQSNIGTLRDLAPSQMRREEPLDTPDTHRPAPSPVRLYVVSRFLLYEPCSISPHTMGKTMELVPEALPIPTSLYLSPRTIVGIGPCLKVFPCISHRNPLSAVSITDVNAISGRWTIDTSWTPPPNVFGTSLSPIIDDERQNLFLRSEHGAIRAKIRLVGDHEETAHFTLETKRSEINVSVVSALSSASRF